MDHLDIQLLEQRDITEIAAACAAVGWNKPASQYERYLAEQDRGERDVLIAHHDGEFVGYLTIVWNSGYQPFADAGVPEIVDFNVLPQWRQRGFGSCLMDVAEHRVSLRSPVVGIGVGMHAGYGSAQRIYAKRGYVPDGRGLVWQDRHVSFGQSVVVDDGLALYFTKRLK